MFDFVACGVGCFSGLIGVGVAGWILLLWVRGVFLLGLVGLNSVCSGWVLGVVCGWLLWWF